jgi:hypothetical protein
MMDVLHADCELVVPDSIRSDRLVYPRTVALRSAEGSNPPPSAPLIAPQRSPVTAGARAAVTSATAKSVRCCGDDLVVGDVADPLGDIPAVTERVGELSVALAPERVCKLVAGLCSSVKRTRPDSVRVVSVDLEHGGRAADRERREDARSGNSLPTCTTESPKAISTVMTLSPGSGMRLSSRAPKALAYQAEASGGVSDHDVRGDVHRLPGGRAAGRRRAVQPPSIQLPKPDPDQCGRDAHRQPRAVEHHPDLVELRQLQVAETSTPTGRPSAIRPSTPASSVRSHWRGRTRRPRIGSGHRSIARSSTAHPGCRP